MVLDIDIEIINMKFIFALLALFVAVVVISVSDFLKHSAIFN